MNEVNLEQYLRENGFLLYRNTGVSMEPLLRQGRDLFTVRKKTDDRCEKFDVILYRRSPDQFVLHRVIEVGGQDYVTLGDNCLAPEYGIREEDVLGIMTSFIRKGKTYSTDDIRYRLYVLLWCRPYRFRIFLRRTIGKIRRSLHSNS